MTPKPDFCRNCPINHVTGDAYVPAQLVEGSTELWIGEAAGENEAEVGRPFVGGAGSWLDSLCRSAKVDRSKISLVNTIGCRPPDNVYPTDVKWHATDRASGREAVGYCFEHHLKPAIQNRNWSRLVTLGDAALKAVGPREGVLVWRGSALPLKDSLKCPSTGCTTQKVGPLVMPTLHPAYIMRQAKLFPVVVGDLRRNLTLPPEHYNLYASPKEAANHVGLPLSFDFEWDYNGSITICGFSSSLFAADVFSWNANNLGMLRKVFEQAPELIGHNIIGADISYLDRLSWDVRWDEVVIWDTMLMQHLVQPDYKHDLGFVASVFTKKVFWKGHGEEQEDEDGNITDTRVQWKTWDSVSAIPRQLGGYGGCGSADEAYRLYNARDTDASFQIAIPLRQKLEQYGLMGVYEHVSVPVAFVCRDIADHGIKLDHSRL